MWQREWQEQANRDRQAEAETLAEAQREQEEAETARKVERARNAGVKRQQELEIANTRRKQQEEAEEVRKQVEAAEAKLALQKQRKEAFCLGVEAQLEAEELSRRTLAAEERAQQDTVTEAEKVERAIRDLDIDAELNRAILMSLEGTHTDRLNIGPSEVESVSDLSLRPGTQQPQVPPPPAPYQTHWGHSS